MQGSKNPHIFNSQANLKTLVSIVANSPAFCERLPHFEEWNMYFCKGGPLQNLKIWLKTQNLTHFDLQELATMGLCKATNSFACKYRLPSVPDPRSCIGSLSALWPVHDLWVWLIANGVVGAINQWVCYGGYFSLVIVLINCPVSKHKLDLENYRNII